MTEEGSAAAGDGHGRRGAASAGRPAQERLADILEAVSYAAGRFLGSGVSGEVIDDVLARLGRATGVSRLYLFENHPGPDGELVASQRHEWTAPGVEPQIDNPELQATPYDGTGFGRWREVLSRGQVLAGDVEDFPPDERALLEAQGITSVAVVPVFTGDGWWGFMGYDETGGSRSWSPVELQALRTAADTLGTAMRRRRMEAELESQRSELMRMALYDPLTGLANRTLFEDRLVHALERTERSELEVAVLFIDLDRFKIVNDTLGHAAGDQLLTSVAERLEERMRDVDTLARFGGDEFAGLLEEMEDLDHAEAVVERLATAFEEPFDLFGTAVHVAASLGLVLSSDELREAEDLLRFSDIAMYRAKEEDGTRYHIFHPSEDEGATVRLHVENELRRALAEEEFVVHYQPVVDLRSGTIASVEALVRWRHPERGLLPPAAFIPIAEESGLIVEVDAHVEREALREVARLRSETGRVDLVVSVNLSPRRLREPDAIDRIAAAVDAFGLPPDALELEITETAAIRRMELLAPLRRLGMRISIDDLGTGYSSLEYLARLDVDTVKIDRSFVSGLGSDRRDAAVVESLLLLARRLELEVVAEGIETEAQLAELRELGCPFGQGYLFSRPVPGEELEALLRGGPLFASK